MWMARQDNPAAYKEVTKDYYAKMRARDEMRIDVNGLPARGWRRTLYSQRYCKDLELDEVLAALIEAALGSGKTEIVGKYLQWKKPKSILIISPRILYTLSVMQRWVYALRARVGQHQGKAYFTPIFHLVGKCIPHKTLLVGHHTQVRGQMGHQVHTVLRCAWRWGEWRPFQCQVPDHLPRVIVPDQGIAPAV
jgi:hypothetical protein